MLDVSGMIGQVPWTSVGVCAGLGGAAWFMLNKTFKKMISNQHKIIHMLEELGRRPTSQPCMLGDQGDKLTELLGRRAVPMAAAAAATVPLVLDDVERPPSIEGAQVLLFGATRLDDVARLVKWCGRPRALVGVDVVPEHLDAARQRLALEQKLAVDLAPLLPDDPTVPVAPASIDYVHCMDDLHTRYPLRQVLKALRKVVKAEGRVRIAVPNEESIYHHLCEPSLLRRPVTTGGPSARPDAAAVYKTEDVVRVAEECGFRARPVGRMVSPLEVSMLPRRAQLARSLPRHHAAFVEELEIDELGRPLYRGELAGHLMVFELVPAK